MKLVNKTKNKDLISSLKLADTFWAKAIGLLGKKSLTANEGILFNKCNSIHTIGMSFPIDIIFLGKNKEVLKVVFCLKPMRLCFGPIRGKYVIETYCSVLRGQVDEGDILSWEE